MAVLAPVWDVTTLCTLGGVDWALPPNLLLLLAAAVDELERALTYRVAGGGPRALFQRPGPVAPGAFPGVRCTAALISSSQGLPPRLPRGFRPPLVAAVAAIVEAVVVEARRGGLAVNTPLSWARIMPRRRYSRSSGRRVDKACA